MTGPGQHKRGAGRAAGFTLPEILVALAVVTIVGLISYSIINTATVLYAKNVALNVSGMKMRAAVDRTLQSVYAADDIPELLDADGQGIGYSLDTPSAGIAFTVDGGAQTRLLWVGDGELRYSESGDPADYDVINSTIHTEDGGATPFQILMMNDKVQLAINLRIREQSYNDFLTLYESGVSNAYFRIATIMRPRDMAE